jgi:hypothetical protein
MEKTEDLNSNTEFKQYLKDGTEIITIDKTYCAICPMYVNLPGLVNWECKKFPYTDNDIGDWYDGPLRRIACMKETGDYDE